MAVWPGPTPGGSLCKCILEYLLRVPETAADYICDLTEVSRPKPELNQVCVRFADYFTSRVINGTTYHCRPRDPQRAIDKPYL